VREIGDLPGPYRAVHALNRLGFGPRPGDVPRLNAEGIERYIQGQLHPESIPLPESLADKVASYRTLHMAPTALFREFQLPVLQVSGDGRGHSRGVGSDFRISGILGSAVLRGEIQKPL